MISVEQQHIFKDLLVKHELLSLYFKRVTERRFDEYCKRPDSKVRSLSGGLHGWYDNGDAEGTKWARLDDAWFGVCEKMKLPLNSFDRRPVTPKEAFKVPEEKYSSFMNQETI